MPTFCELCGNEIPDTLNACPTCGLRIDFDENRPDPGESEPLGGTPPGDQENSWLQADSDPFAGLNQEPGSPLDYPYGNAQQTLPPGSWPPPQPDMGGGFPPPPPGQQVPGAWGTPPGGYGPPATDVKKKKFPVALIVILAVGILILGASAFAYFVFLKPAGTDDAATAMVVKYLNAVGSGDAQTVASLHATGMQPSQETLNAISLLGSMMKLSYSGLRTEAVTGGSEEMEVKITAATLDIDVGGNKKSVTLEDMKKAFGDGFKAVSVKLKKQNGQWMVNQQELIDPFAIQIDSTTPIIPSSSSS